MPCCYRPAAGGRTGCTEALAGQYRPTYAPAREEEKRTAADHRRKDRQKYPAEDGAGVRWLRQAQSFKF